MIDAKVWSAFKIWPHWVKILPNPEVQSKEPGQNFDVVRETGRAGCTSFSGRAMQVPRQKPPRRARPIIEEENLMKNPGKWMFALSIGVFAGSAALADGYKNCTKVSKASWKPATEAEAQAKAAGYEVRRSKVEGSCYEVYGVKEGKLYELFYSPEDLSLKHTTAK
jgi:hypothetical protein